MARRTRPDRSQSGGLLREVSSEITGQPRYCNSTSQLTWAQLWHIPKTFWTVCTSAAWHGEHRDCVALQPTVRFALVRTSFHAFRPKQLGRRSTYELELVVINLVANLDDLSASFVALYRCRQTFVCFAAKKSRTNMNEPLNLLRSSRIVRSL